MIGVIELTVFSSVAIFNWCDFNNLDLLFFKLNVCIGAMFYEPVSKHMKRTLVPRDKSIPKSPQEQVDQSNQAQIESKPSQQLHQRQVG